MTMKSQNPKAGRDALSVATVSDAISGKILASGQSY
jgi:hypothetical protein